MSADQRRELLLLCVQPRSSASNLFCVHPRSSASNFWKRGRGRDARSLAHRQSNEKYWDADERRRARRIVFSLRSSAFICVQFVLRPSAFTCVQFLEAGQGARRVVAGAQKTLGRGRTQTNAENCFCSASSRVHLRPIFGSGAGGATRGRWRTDSQTKNIGTRTSADQRRELLLLCVHPRSPASNLFCVQPRSSASNFWKRGRERDARSLAHRQSNENIGTRTNADQRRGLLLLCPKMLGRGRTQTSAEDCFFSAFVCVHLRPIFESGAESAARGRWRTKNVGTRTNADQRRELLLLCPKILGRGRTQTNAEDCFCSASSRVHLRPICFASIRVHLRPIFGSAAGSAGRGLFLTPARFAL